MAESLSQAGARWQWAEPWWEQVVVHWAEKHAMHLRTGNVNRYPEHGWVVDDELLAFDDDRGQRVVDAERLDRGHGLKR